MKRNINGEYTRRNKVLDEEVLIGIILGDAWLERRRMARLRFEQSHIRTEF